MNWDVYVYLGNEFPPLGSLAITKLSIKALSNFTILKKYLCSGPINKYKVGCREVIMVYLRLIVTHLYFYIAQNLTVFLEV